MITESFSCPLPKTDYETIQLAHGAGGKLSAELIDQFILPRFNNDILKQMEDQAVLDMPNGRLAFTTDSYTVDPIFFPGGNIGELAINGTVNDISMSGGQPLYLSVGFIIEEGFPLQDFHNILLSMENAAKKAGILIVTGDTKVVHKGCCDKIFINTSGVGVVPKDIHISASNLKVGDKIIVSGTIADHGMAVMTTRNNLSFQSQVQSDTAPLNGLVSDMIKVTTNIHALRDPTRGGLATSLNEFAKSSQVGIRLLQDTIPVRPEVKGACEILGIDPLYVANEGKLVAVVDKDYADDVLQKMKANEYGQDSVIIGEVIDEHPGILTMTTPLGVNRIVDMPIGEQLPRIC